MTDTERKALVKRARTAESEERRKTYNFTRETAGLRTILGMEPGDNGFRRRIRLVLQENHNLRLMLAEKLATWSKQ